jgi:hypothetical protein
MTTNERLFASGLLESFNRAVKSCDRATMVELLMAADILKPAAEQIADVELAEIARDGN